MAKSRKHSRRSRKTRRGGFWPFTSSNTATDNQSQPQDEKWSWWPFGKKDAPTPPNMTGAVESSEEVSTTAPSTTGAARRHKTRRSKSRRSRS